MIRRLRVVLSRSLRQALYKADFSVVYTARPVDIQEFIRCPNASGLRELFRRNMYPCLYIAASMHITRWGTPKSKAPTLCQHARVSIYIYPWDTFTVACFLKTFHIQYPQVYQ